MVISFWQIIAFGLAIGVGQEVGAWAVVSLKEFLQGWLASELDDDDAFERREHQREAAMDLRYEEREAAKFAMAVSAHERLIDTLAALKATTIGQPFGREPPPTPKPD